MPYPKITIDLNKLKQNVSIIVRLCKRNGIKVAGVTKVFCGNRRIAQAYMEAGVSYLADSRVENLKEYKDKNIKKIMLRLPMISEAQNVVRYADISLNSEIDTIKALSKNARDLGKSHGIILMVDLGDLREGYFKEENLMEAVEIVLGLEGVSLIGLGTNMTCYGGVIPRLENFQRIVDLKENIKDKYGLELDMISGGNSSALHLLKNNKLPINNLRIGEAFVLGRETAFGKRIEGTFDDVFILEAEVIEIKDKPSVPTGEIGKDAFGRNPRFIDRGIRRRAICAVGQQDINLECLIPVDKRVIALGASSDHLILDITDSKKDYRIGDTIRFKLTYGGILSSMTSKYVSKHIKE